MSQTMIEWDSNGNIHRYNQFESLLMVLITGISNIAIIPSIVLVYRHNLIFQTFIGILTFVTSFTYHFMDSVGLLKLFLTDLEWHRLGSIMSISCLLVYLADLKDNDMDIHIDFWIFFVVLILQEAEPWNINYTIAPILLTLLLVVIIKLKQRKLPKYNMRMFNKGIFLLSLAIFFFTFGLDEKSDYLRIFHGCWHIFVGLMSFYLWQAKEPFDNIFSFRTVFSKKILNSYIDDKMNLE